MLLAVTEASDEVTEAVISENRLVVPVVKFVDEAKASIDEDSAFTSD